MSIREDVFGLEQVYRLQVEGLWIVKSDVWLAPSPYYAPVSDVGYFGGGNSSSVVDRIDYSNDTATASVRGPLNVNKYYPGATGNSSFGYFGGGSPGPLSTVDRIDYSNDTATASPKGPLSVGRYALAASSARANALPVIDSTLPPANSPTQVFP